MENNEDCQAARIDSRHFYKLSAFLTLSFIAVIFVEMCSALHIVSMLVSVSMLAGIVAHAHRTNVSITKHMVGKIIRWLYFLLFVSALLPAITANVPLSYMNSALLMSLIMSALTSAIVWCTSYSIRNHFETNVFPCPGTQSALIYPICCLAIFSGIIRITNMIIA